MNAGAEDCAWAKIEVPQAPAELHAFLADVGRLFRINPWLEFERIDPVRPGTWYLRGQNDANQQAFDLQVTRTADHAPNLLALCYDHGIKRETRFTIEANGNGSVLTLSDHYETPPEAERAQRLEEVDRSLLPWAAALRAHLRRERRWGRLPGYGWCTRQWLSMAPRHRRVARLLIWSTVAEFVVFVAVLAVYVSAGR